MIVKRILCLFLIFFGKHIFAQDRIAKPNNFSYEIPYLENIIVDGKSEDWGDHGMRSKLFYSDSIAKPRDKNDFDVELRIAWNNTGLLFLLKVVDDDPQETKDRKLWKGDSIEIFIAKKVGVYKGYQLVISPGISKQYPNLRFEYFKKGKLVESVKPEIKSLKTQNGYILELLCPWNDLKIKAEKWDLRGLQIYVTDKDEKHPLKRKLFYPQHGAHADFNLMHRIKLGEKCDGEISASAFLSMTLDGYKIEVISSKENAGRTVKVLSGEKVLKEDVLKESSDASHVEFLLKGKDARKQFSNLNVKINEENLFLKYQIPARICNPVNISLAPLNKLGQFEVSADISYPENWIPDHFDPKVKITIENAQRKKVKSLVCGRSKKVKLNIPQDGESTLVCQISIGKLVIGQRTIVFHNGVPLNNMADKSPTPVLALSTFCDFTKCRGTTHDLMHLRSKVIANLMRNYDVIILNRSNGISLSNERKLNVINKLEEDNPSPDLLPGADYAITSYFNVARRTRGHASNLDIGCVLFVSNLHDQSETNYKKSEFIPYEPTLYDADVTKEIVKALKLKPRKQTLEKQETAQLDETWAVMPITRLETEKSMNLPADKDLALEIELTLQQSNRIKRIVDHNDIDKVLRELKISSFDTANGGVAGTVAKIFGADKIISGVIGKSFFGKNDLRVDLFLVDAKSTVTLGSVSASVKSKKEISELVRNLVIELISKNYSIPKIKNVDVALLKKEAALYEEIFYTLSKQIISPRNIATLAKSFAEMIYLIEHKDDVKIYKVAKYLYLRIFDDKLTLTKKRELAEFIDKLLKPIQASKDTPCPLLYRALSLSRLPSRIDEAITLANQHLVEHPDFYPNYANFVIGKCYFQKKDYQKAIEFAEKGKRGDAAKYLLINIYRTLGGRDNNEKELECLKLLNVRENSTSYNVFRKLKLIREIDGPKAALKYLKRLGAWTILRPEIRLEEAQAYLELGMKKEAAIIIDGMANNRALNRSNLKDAKQKAILKKEVFRLRKELDSYLVPWKTYSEVVNIPDKYKFYIRPMNNPNMIFIKNAIPLMEEYLGCRVEILPNLPMPEDSFCFKKGRGQYNSYCVQQRLKRLVTYPDDAISIAEITGKSIFCGKLRYVYGSPYFGSYLISYNSWHGAGNEYVLTSMLAKTASGGLEISASLPSCSQPLCMKSSDGSALGSKYKRFKLCPKCCEKLSKKSHEWILENFRQRYQSQLGFARNDRREWDAEYNIIIQKKLAEARKKTEIEAKKSLNYLPATTLDKEPQKGIAFKYFEFEQDACKTTEDLKKLTPKEKGVTDAFNLSKAKLKKHFGLEFEGLIKIPHDGKYQFYLSSYGGSRLWVESKELINNDGLHSAKTKSAGIALKAGYHPIKLSFIQGKSGKLLTLYYRGAKTLGQKVPASVLFTRNK